ncbi:MAG: hypothetical protein HYV07_16385 [Deltaproteobacteria bacterium]|nr:hypothetical protein [Deltaproteobacteria bacterium]
MPPAPLIPRSFKARHTEEVSTPQGFMQRTQALFRRHERAVAGVMLGASAFSALAGAPAAHAATPAPTTSATGDGAAGPF